MEAFGHKNPSRTEVFETHGALVASMFAKGTQGRADISRSLRQEVGEMVETHGPNFLSAPELERLRFVSSHGRRGTSQAAPAAAARLRAASPKGNTFSPGAKARLRSRPRTPERPPRLLVLCHRATSNRSLRHSGLDMRLGHLFRGVGGGFGCRRGSRHPGSRADARA